VRADGQTFEGQIAVESETPDLAPYSENSQHASVGQTSVNPESRTIQSNVNGQKRVEERCRIR